MTVQDRAEMLRPMPMDLVRTVPVKEPAVEWTVSFDILPTTTTIYVAYYFNSDGLISYEILP